MRTISNLMKAAFGGFATMALCASAFAQSDRMIEGTVVDIDVQNRSGTLTIENSDTGERETYTVTPSTELTVRNNPGSVLSRTNDIDAISDLEPGDEVKLDVLTAADGRFSVRRLERDSIDDRQTGRTADTRTTAAADTRADTSSSRSTTAYDSQRDRNDRTGSSADYDYDALPSTATAMPLFAVIGLFALMSGLVIRTARSLMQK